MASAYYVQSNPDDQVNRCLASQTGLTLRQVEFLRREFSKHGRNPMPEMLEILAVENGFEENKVKNLFNLHIAHLFSLTGRATSNIYSVDKVVDGFFVLSPAVAKRKSDSQLNTNE
ncbi:hypothetical protein T05_9570 [Trichinella murrelli]|uniref:Uncharacterized protein n=1 Tax=Trichinella murrelli TaxID=144512 RepID=A0A0V0U0D1_9BILA|nr:hypothetical protein T05_9570 [Trichinella murrelli]